MAKIIEYQIQIVIFSFTIFCNVICFAQSKNENIFVMVGMMDFHLGPQRILEHPKEGNKINFFFPSENESFEEFKKLALNVGLSLEDFEIEVDHNFDGVSGPTIYSEKLKPLFNNFFRYKSIGTHYFEEEPEKGYRLYKGYIKKSKFNTQKAKILFLKGLFLRYGTITEKGVYQYNLASFSTNRRMICNFLRKSKSRIVSIEDNPKDLVPGSGKISFIPSLELKGFLTQTNK